MREYYFVLGKRNSDKRFIESFENAEKDLGIRTLKNEVNDLTNKLSVLVDVLGVETLKTYFKMVILSALAYRAVRTSDLIYTPFYWDRSNAFKELMAEGKIVQTKT